MDGGGIRESEGRKPSILHFNVLIQVTRTNLPVRTARDLPLVLLILSSVFVLLHFSALLPVFFPNPEPLVLALNHPPVPF